jgi:hypothetical protein
MSHAQVFNPLDKKSLGESVVQALERVAPVSLSALAEFKGAGLYALYFQGSLPPYAALAARNRPVPSHPIYVGKAVPAGARKGANEITGIDSRSLWQRLREHAESIKVADGIAPEDFTCRHLVVDDIWIGLGESLLIQAYAPLWNTVVEGFGNHDPGAGRRRGKRPAWDELHPGRVWAKRLQPAKLNRALILEEVASYMSRFSLQSPPKSSP